MSTLVETTSPVQAFRDFITQRLTAAALEIFSVFEQTVAQYEEEIDRQRRLLQSSEKTGIKFHRIEHPDQNFCDDNELWDQERVCSPDQEGPVQIKDEEEEEEEEEDAEPGRTETMRTDCDDGKTPRIKEEAEAPEITLSLDEMSSVQDDEQLAQNLREEFSDDQRKRTGRTRPDGLDRRQRVTSGPSGRRDPVQRRRGADAENSAASDGNCLKLVVSGDEDTSPSRLKDKLRVCKGEKPFVCSICGKSFRRQRCLCVHMMTHTGEKPYSCEVCGNRFRQPGHLRAHKRIHTGEKPYSCKTCGQIFRQYGHLFTHRKRHSRAKSQA